MLKNIQEWVLLFVIVGLVVVIGNWIGYTVMPLEAIPGEIGRAHV